MDSLGRPLWINSEATVICATRLPPSRLLPALPRPGPGLTCGHLISRAAAYHPNTLLDELPATRPGELVFVRFVLPEPALGRCLSSSTPQHGFRGDPSYFLRSWTLSRFLPAVEERLRLLPVPEGRTPLRPRTLDVGARKHLRVRPALATVWPDAYQEFEHLRPKR